MEVTYIQRRIEGPEIVRYKKYLPDGAISACNNTRSLNFGFTVRVVYSGRSDDRDCPQLAKSVRKIKSTLKRGNVTKNSSLPGSGQHEKPIRCRWCITRSSSPITRSTTSGSGVL
jgi:hypothetical protein